MERKYTSFTEIENDLRALKLKKDIDLLCLKSDYQTLLRNLSISGLFADSVAQFRSAIAEKQKSLLSLVAGFLLRKFF
jgi:hypothetical protein|nr:DUF6327 family protein [uncultured Capnocytophaga sp.]